MKGAARLAAPALMLAMLVGGCVAEPTPSPSTPVSPAASPTPTALPSSTPVSASPSATPEPPFSLDRPETRDDRVVSVSVVPAVDAEGGQVVVTVTSGTDSRIDELVLRWTSELNETLFLAPFVPSEERIRDGGDPLVQPWTKWVVGPGEHGEPAGTISLGYGPLLAGATLEIPLFATRADAGPIAFDLQVLAGNDLLTLEDGEPAALRVEIP